jgi:hypothetical protein
MKKLLFLSLLAIGLPFVGSQAQITSPKEGVPYVVHNSYGGGSLVLSRGESNCIIETRQASNQKQQWYFEAADGAYRMKNKGTGEYVFLGTADTWSLAFSTSMPTDVTKGEYTFEALDAQYVAIKLKQNSKYYGTDATTSGAIVYTDKATSNGGAKWYLEELSNDPSVMYMNMYNEVGDSIIKVFANCDVIAGALSDSLQLINDKYEASETDTMFKEGVSVLEKYLDYINTLRGKLIDLKSQLTSITTILNTTDYPGKSDLQAAFDKYDAIINAVTPNNTMTIADLTTLPNELSAAIRTYCFSQTASADSPADITLLVKNPWFCKDANRPASNSDEDITAANQSANVVDGTGWIKGSTTTSAGGRDEHASYREARTCWNAWATNFNGYLDVHQDLVDLPDGFYGVTCDAITQDGCLNDQNLYAASVVQRVTANLTTESWVNPDDTGKGVWEALNTANTAKTLLVNGKLTIGFRGSHNSSKVSGTASDGRNGWFCVSNFKLQYYGPSTESDLISAYQNVVAADQAQCDTMVFKGDKATYQGVINEFKGASTRADIIAALDTLGKAQVNAATSIGKQVEVLTGSYKAIQDSIAANVYDAALKPVMQSAVDAAKVIINADAQTYACRDTVINCLRAYRITYADEYNKAMKAIATYTQQSSKDVVNNTIALQLGELRQGLLSPAIVADFVAKLESALADAAANELVAKGGTDYTAMISNPGCTSTGKKVVPTGWTASLVNSGNGQYCNTGQQYDGDANAYYLDAWNGTAKALLINVHQTIKNLPNGTYTLKAMCRTSGDVGNEGTYLYTIADNDSTKTALACVKRELCNITTDTQGAVKKADGTDSTLYVMDTYGSIWEAAAAATQYGTTGSEADMAIYGANSNAGRGWHYVEVPAVVTNHLLVIGFTNDSTFTVGHKDVEGKDCVPFTGSWLSADSFTLTQTAAGDNTNWSPVTAISTAKVTDRLIVEVRNGRIFTNKSSMVYSLNGQLVNARAALPQGVYIVKSGKQAVKVSVK